MGNRGERRSGPRLALEASALIRLESISADVQTRISNASERGLLLTLPVARPVGTRIRVTVQIQDPPWELSVVGVIVHVTPRTTPDGKTEDQAGILLTEAGPEWLEFCQRLAGDAPK